MTELSRLCNNILQADRSHNNPNQRVLGVLTPSAGFNRAEHTAVMKFSRRLTTIFQSSLRSCSVQGEYVGVGEKRINISARNKNISMLTQF